MCQNASIDLHELAANGTLQFQQLHLVQCFAPQALNSIPPRKPAMPMLQFDSADQLKEDFESQMNAGFPPTMQESPLHLAVLNGHWEVTKMLLDAKANVEVAARVRAYPAASNRCTTAAAATSYLLLCFLLAPPASRQTNSTRLTAGPLSAETETSPPSCRNWQCAAGSAADLPESYLGTHGQCKSPLQQLRLREDVGGAALTNANPHRSSCRAFGDG